MQLAAAVRSDVGCVRESNEDAAVWIPGPAPAAPPHAGRGALVVVADGMGGHAAGEVASRMAVEAVRECYYGSTLAAGEALASAVVEANRRIYDRGLADPRLHGMGTTCSALGFVGAGVVAAHVGDSRIYRLRAGSLECLTQDDTLVAALVELGQLTPDEARVHPSRHVLVRALGTQHDVEIGGWKEPVPVRAGDRFLVCSDGLHDVVEDEEIGRILSTAEPEQACAALIGLARERGGPDNITVAVVVARANPA